MHHGGRNAYKALHSVVENVEDEGGRRKKLRACTCSCHFGTCKMIDVLPASPRPGSSASRIRKIDRFRATLIFVTLFHLLDSTTGAAQKKDLAGEETGLQGQNVLHSFVFKAQGAHLSTVWQPGVAASGRFLTLGGSYLPPHPTFFRFRSPSMVLRMREKRNILYLLLVFVVFSLLLYANKDALPAGFSISDLAIGISAAQLPKITVIAIWTISKPQPPAFFPFFFHSVESNPEVDLLFVQIDKLGHGCPKNSDAPNVIEVCLTEDECQCR